VRDSKFVGEKRAGSCCRVLQSVAVCCSMLQRVAVCCSALQCVTMCCSVLQGVEVVKGAREHSTATRASVRDTRMNHVTRDCTHE